MVRSVICLDNFIGKTEYFHANLVEFHIFIDINHKSMCKPLKLTRKIV